MFKSFKLWVEEKEEEKKLKTIFLKRLGLEPDALEIGPDMKLISFSKEKLKEAISNIGLDENSVSNLINFIEMSHKTSTLSALLTQIKDTNIDVEEAPEEELPGQPAQLPQGTPKPPPPQMQPSPQNFNM